VSGKRAGWSHGGSHDAEPGDWLDQIPAPAAVLSPRGELLACNEEADALFGWIEDRPAHFGSASVAWLRELVEKAGDEGVARTVISRRVGGTRIAIELRCRVTRDGSLLVLFRDCTAQVVGRKMRRSGEHHLRGFLDRLPEPVLIEQAGLIAYCNAALAHVMGESDAAALRGQPVSRVLSPDAQARIRDALHTPSALQPDLELTLTAGTGVQRTVQVSPLPLQYRRRPAVQLLMRDVTAQRQAEAGLRASHERLRAITEGMRDHAIITLDAACRIMSWNSAAERMTGHRADDVVGSRIDALFIEELDPDAPVFAIARRDGRGYAELTIRRADGEELPVQLTFSSLLDPTQALIGFAAIIHDVSERRRVEESLRRSEEQLRHAQKMDAIGRLAAGVAHDFNNLITAIQGHVQFLLEDLPQDSSAREDAVEIRRAADRATELTRQLLTFARRQPSSPQSLDLNRVITEVEKLLQRLLRADVALETDLAADLPLTLADRGELEQVIVNLVVNARDAMADGGIVTIRTSPISFDETYTARGLVLEPGDYVMLSVTDTGIGMSPETQRQVFEPFFTTKAEGTGLGLPTAYGIVQRAGGHFSIYSEEGTGTTFKVFLPVHPDSTTDSGARLAARAAAGSNGTHGRVLVVDDDEAVRSLSARALAASGLAVMTAASGEEALTLLAGHVKRVDVLVTDLMMPSMSGDRLAQQVCERFPDAGVVLMSGFPEGTLPDSTLHQPRERFLEKPFTPDLLLGAVRDLLRERRTN
jgi:two-component system, cell cycle sensor histidine kinase and response regulator CckA